VRREPRRCALQCYDLGVALDLDSMIVRIGALRFRAAARRSLSRPGHGERSGDLCVICGSPRSAYESVTFENNPKLVRSVSACSGCGYVSIAELPLDRYRGKTSVDELPSGGTRIGTQEKPGREFKMARMAIDILGRTDLEVPRCCRTSRCTSGQLPSRRQSSQMQSRRRMPSRPRLA